MVWRASVRSAGILIMVLAVMMVSQCGKQPENTTNEIPLPEHPRPDFSRPQWVNLNGRWDFSLDSLEVGESHGWHRGDMPFPDKITVPFSWASPLSGIGEKDVHIGWYARNIDIPRGWKSKHVFLVIGASDCITTVWLNGAHVGEHEGGYTPFEFDLTDFFSEKAANRLVIRVEDKPTRGRLVGKQVYGHAKGIWQTVYLEARPDIHITRAHFSPDIDGEYVTLKISLSQPFPEEGSITLAFDNADVGLVVFDFPAGKDSLKVVIPINNPHLWCLEDPYLYDVDLILKQGKKECDRIHSYFGMRKIGMAKLPGSGDMYITLNNKPLYLYMALDQSYHPEGYYTFPCDTFMKEEIERAKNIGLNGLRIHIKTEVPRKLYWADRLGLLIMADIPNIGHRL